MNVTTIENTTDNLGNKVTKTTTTTTTNAQTEKVTMWGVGLYFFVVTVLILAPVIPLVMFMAKLNNM